MPVPSVSMPSVRRRAGVTLLELLVVLTLLVVGAAVVAPALRAPDETRIVATFGPEEALRQARVTAVQRGEPLRLRIADGAWALVAERTGEIVRGGQADSAAAMDVRIDALGTCMPSGIPSATAGDEPAYDMLRCRTVVTRR